MTSDKDNIRRDKTAIEQALRDAGAISKGRYWSCPFHEDKHPSSSIHAGEDGVWKFKCFAASCGFHGDVFDIIARGGGKPVEDQLRELKQDQPSGKAPPRVYATIQELAGWKGTIERDYRYVSPETGAAELIVVRVKTPEGKTFIQCRPNPGGGFILGAPPKPWPIYNRTRIKGAARVVWVEGEKAVHALHDIGIVATTSPAGSSNADNADYSPMNGVAEVVVWPDHDEPKADGSETSGMKYANAVVKNLQASATPPLISMIDPASTGLEADGSDAVEYIAEFGGDTLASRKEAVEFLLKSADPVSAASDLYAMLEEGMAGGRKSLAWPWPVLTRQAKALLPATITVLCGAPGSTKSFFVLETAWMLHAQGVKVSVLELEDDRAYHLQRVLAQISERADLTDPDWQAVNNDKVRQAIADQRAFMDSFAPRVFAAPDKAMMYKDVLKWIQEQCAAGAELLIIDPITAATGQSDKTWIEDQKLIVEAKILARTHRVPIVLVTHPKKGGGRIGASSLDDLAGGAAFQRFAHCILWLERHDSPIDVKIIHPSQEMPFHTKINRLLKILKARNGVGAGKHIGFDFTTGNLRFIEYGLIDKRKQGAESTEDVTP